MPVMYTLLKSNMIWSCRAKPKRRTSFKKEPFFVERYAKYSRALYEETKPEKKICRLWGSSCNRCYVFIVSLFLSLALCVFVVLQFLSCRHRKNNPFQLNYGNPINSKRLTGQTSLAKECVCICAFYQCSI